MVLFIIIAIFVTTDQSTHEENIHRTISRENVLPEYVFFYYIKIQPFNAATRTQIDGNAIK